MVWNKGLWIPSQEDIKEWLAEKISKTQVNVKDPVIPQTKLFVKVLQDARHVATPIYSVSQYFSRIGMDYFKVLSLCMEKRVNLSSIFQDICQ